MAFAIPLAGMAAGAAGTAGTIGSLASIASLVGTGLSVIGSFQQAQGQKASAQASANAARYNAQVARNNEILAQQNKVLAAREGAQKVYEQQMKTRAELAGMEAAQGASGVRLDSKSFLDVQSSAKELGELSAIDIRAKAARQAYGYDIEAATHRSNAQLNESQAQSDIMAGDIQSSSTILGGLSSAASGYSDYLDKRGF